MTNSLLSQILVLVSSYPYSTRLCSCSSPFSASLKVEAENTLHGIPIVKASPSVCVEDRDATPVKTLGASHGIVVAYLPENRIDAASASAMLCHHIRPTLLIIAGPAVSFSRHVNTGDPIVSDTVYRRVELPMTIQGNVYEPSRALLKSASLILGSLLSSQPVKQLFAAAMFRRGQEDTHGLQPRVHQLPVVNLHPIAHNATRAVVRELASRYPNGWVADTDSSSVAEICGEAAIPWLAVRVAVNNQPVQVEGLLTEEVTNDDALLAAGRLSERLAVALAECYLQRSGAGRGQDLRIHSPSAPPSLLDDVNGSEFSPELLFPDTVF